MSPVCKIFNFYFFFYQIVDCLIAVPLGGGAKQCHGLANRALINSLSLVMMNAAVHCTVLNMAKYCAAPHYTALHCTALQYGLRCP